MRKHIVEYATVAVVAAVLTTLIQPLRHLEAFAHPQVQAPGQAQILGQRGECRNFPETGKQVCGRFLQYWLQNGGLPQQGYPISNELREKSQLDQREYTVQYFERAVFELHPENRPPFDVLLSQLGTFRFKEKYPNGEPGALPAPTATPVPPPGIGVPVPIPHVEGLTVSAYEEPDFEECYNENDMTWYLRIENQGRVPANVRIEKSSISMTDSTGKIYQLPKTVGCQTSGQAGGFDDALTPNGTSLNPGRGMTGLVRLTANDVPPSVSYFDLRININGVSVTFRYTVK